MQIMLNFTRSIATTDFPVESTAVFITNGKGEETRQPGKSLRCSTSVTINTAATQEHLRAVILMADDSLTLPSGDTEGRRSGGECS